MTKKLRQQVYDKFDGKCAYSGTVLKEDWQVDHLIPKAHGVYLYCKDVNDISNLVPCQRIINHYKRALDLKTFREWYLMNLHIRLKKLPKNPKVQKSIRHKEYLLEVASLFGITETKSFDGIFYFETIKH